MSIGTVVYPSQNNTVVPLSNNGISARFLKGGLHISNPEISIIVGHFGFEMAVEQVLTFLPSSVALAFDVYSNIEKKWIDKAHEQGNSVFLTVSSFKFISGNASSPVSLNLYTQESDIHEWGKRIGSTLKGFLIDRNICQDTRSFAALTNYIKKQNLLILLSEAGENTQTICGNHPEKCFVGDVVIQAIDSNDQIERKLEATKLLAEKQGYANLVVFLSSSQMFTMLKNWMTSLNEKSFIFVPVEKNLTKENRYG